LSLDSHPQFIEFVYTATFERSAERILAECDLEMLERELVRNPRAGRVERGLGGVRKIRIRRSGLGKSRGARVLYYINYAKARVYLLLAYSKSAQPVLNQQQRKTILALVDELERGRECE
jgi:hypothetical protein